MTRQMSTMEQILLDMQVPEALIHLVMDYAPACYVDAAPKVRLSAMRRVYDANKRMDPPMTQDMADCLIQVADDLCALRIASSSSSTIPSFSSFASTASDFAHGMATKGGEEEYNTSVEEAGDGEEEEEEKEEGYRQQTSTMQHIVETMRPFQQLHSLLLDAVLLPTQSSIDQDEAADRKALQHVLFAPFCLPLQPERQKEHPALLRPLDLSFMLFNTGYNAAYDEWTDMRRAVEREATARLTVLAKYPSLYPLIVLWFVGIDVSSWKSPDVYDDDEAENKTFWNFTSELRNTLLDAVTPAPSPAAIQFAAELGMYHIVDKIQQVMTSRQTLTSQDKAQLRAVARHVRRQRRERKIGMLLARVQTLQVRQVRADKLSLDEDSTNEDGTKAESDADANSDEDSPYTTTPFL